MRSTVNPELRDRLQTISDSDPLNFDQAIAVAQLRQTHPHSIEFRAPGPRLVGVFNCFTYAFGLRELFPNRTKLSNRGLGGAPEFAELEGNRPGLRGLPARLLARVRGTMSTSYKEMQAASFLRGETWHHSRSCRASCSDDEWFVQAVDADEDPDRAHQTIANIFAPDHIVTTDTHPK
jgi:hypothetical protein